MSLAAFRSTIAAVAAFVPESMGALVAVYAADNIRDVVVAGAGAGDRQLLLRLQRALPRVRQWGEAAAWAAQRAGDSSVALFVLDTLGTRACDLRRSKDRILLRACESGELELAKRLWPDSAKQPCRLLDAAARGGRIDVMRWVVALGGFKRTMVESALWESLPHPAALQWLCREFVVDGGLVADAFRMACARGAFASARWLRGAFSLGADDAASALCEGAAAADEHIALWLACTGAVRANMERASSLLSWAVKSKRWPLVRALAAELKACADDDQL